MLGAVNYSSDDEKDQGEREVDEEIYTPQQSEYNVVTREADIVESEIKTGAKRRKMGPRCKVGGKRENPEPANKEESGKSKPTVVCSNDKFECSICGRIFDNKALRDMHEDAERAEHFFKCPLCDGFFGSEESKLIHMQDRHGIATKEFAEERANRKLGVAKNKSAVKKKEALLTKMAVSSQDDYKDSSEKGSTDDSRESLAVEIKQEKTSENATECDMCDMKFYETEELKEHIQTFHGAVQ
uniref:C2H2-type domain-containing protein n=1 Tax=Magallana gigas TaxID=29159 RepID=K1QIS4_MAGGI